jgi:hypothetical protein
MKIKKLTPQELLDGTLDFKMYKKVLKNLLATMETEHNSPESPTQFLVKTDYEFSDKKGKKMAVLIPGKQAGAWMVYAKAQVKTDKKLTSIGTCYLEVTDGKKVIKLAPSKGAAKRTLMQKQLDKFILKPLGVELEIVGSLAEGEDASDDVDTVEDTSNVEDIAGSDVQAELKKTIAQIAKVNKAINLKDGLDESDLQKAEALKKLIRKFAAILKTADAELRNEFGETFLKTKKLYKKIELEIERLKSEEDNDLDSALDDMLDDDSSDTQDEGIQVSNADNKEDAIEANRILMDEINSLVEEVNLFELA